MSNTLFSHLALQFSAHPENLATEALAFILKKSNTASKAFVQYLGAIAPNIPDDLRYETQQAGLDDSIPDVKCFDSTGRLRVIVENKFWAGFTDNQPVTYIRELRSSGPGLLLLIVPEARCRLVWDEMCARCAAAEIAVAGIEQAASTMLADLGNDCRLAVVSWRSVLNALAAAADLASDALSRNDILQLQGLCNRMDTDAFLPLRGDEITNLELARRIVNLSDLPFDIMAEAKARGYCDRKGLHETASRYGSGAYVRIGDYTPWLGFDARAWSQFGLSPIWIIFAPPPLGSAAGVREKLARFRSAVPQRCFDLDGLVAVPLFLMAGFEKHALVTGAVQQLAEILTELSMGTASAATAS